MSRRSMDGGLTWSDLSVVCHGRGANGTAATHACQQPTPISDFTTGKIFLLMSLDNWHQRLYSSTDDGLTWSSPSDLDSVLRKDGWGLVFNGLPGGIQLRNGSAHAGRLIGCSSAYWSGGKLNPDGSIAKQGDHASRFSFSIISDDGGASWRIGSGPVGRFHTTECSISQSYTTDALYMYTRLWVRRR